MSPSSAVSRGLAMGAALVVSLGALAASAHLGFSVSAETDGLFSTTLKQVKVTEVVPGAPADKAGLLKDDDVESVNDVPIAGTSGTRIMEMVHAVRPGDHLRLKVRRGEGEKVVDIVGEAPQ